MMLDALLQADRHFTMTGPDGEKFRLSEACDNVKLFCQLTDEYLVRSLQFSLSPELANTRHLLARITTRDLYKLVGFTDLGNASVPVKDLHTRLEEIIESHASNLKAGDITILRKRVNMGMGNSNPVEKVSFFDKRGETKVFNSDQLRRDLPRDFSSQCFLMVCRKSDMDSVREANEIYREWSKDLPQ